MDSHLGNVEKWMIIIDLDGTIVDSETANFEAFQQMLEEFGYMKHFNTILRIVADGTDVEDAVNMMNVTPETKEKMEERMKFLLSRDPAPLLPEAKENIEILKKSGLLICIATDSYFQTVVRVIHKHNMEHLFDLRFILAIDIFPKRKPSQVIVEELVRRSGRKRAIIVGNSPKDVAMAQNSGCSAVILINLNESGKGTFDYEKEIFGEISGDNVYSVKSWDDVRKAVIEIIKKKSMEE